MCALPTASRLVRRPLLPARLAALLLLLATSRAALAVSVEVLNDVPPGANQVEVVQGDPVLVRYQVSPLERSSSSDLIQLRDMADAAIIDEEVRGDSLNGRLALDTSAAQVSAILEVVYVYGPSGTVLATADLAVRVVEDTGEAPDLVEFPGADVTTLQGALDLVADGGTVQIGAGTFEVTEPLYVVGKRVVIEGAGEGRTLLAGPEPQPVTDDLGDIVLEAAGVEGVLNLLGSEAEVRDLALSGGDAGILIADATEGDGAAVDVQDVVIGGTGRGVLALSSGDLALSDTTIHDTLWNAVSVAPPFGFPIYFHVDSVSIVDPEGAGIYVSDTLAFIADAIVMLADAGGIVGVDSNVYVEDCGLYMNTEAGILLYDNGGGDSGGALLNNDIGNTFPLDGVLGDGIVLFGTHALITDNTIWQSARAGMSMFGSTADLGGNDIYCAAFDLDVEEYDGTYTFPNDLGGNICGCVGDYPRPCQATSSTLQPPGPMGGLE